MTPLQTNYHHGIFCRMLNVVKNYICSRCGLQFQVKSQNAPRIGLWHLTRAEACSQANVASALSITKRAQQHPIMAEQLPNGDAPISADVEMKEESVAEV